MHYCRYWFCKLINKIDAKNTIIKFLKVYILSFFIFIVIGIVVDYGVLLVLFGNELEYDITVRLMNTLTLAFLLVDIFALTSAFLYFRQSQKTALELEQTEKEKATLQSQMLQKNLDLSFYSII